VLEDNLDECMHARARARGRRCSYTNLPAMRVRTNMLHSQPSNILAYHDHYTHHIVNIVYNRDLRARSSLT
jgi:hypothetical protein